MKKLTKTLLVLATTTIGLSLLPSQVNALVTTTPQANLTDIDFNNLITTGKFTEVFVAQSRIGNNATNGTQEIDLLNPKNNLLPVDQKQRVWGNGEAVDFILEYTGSLVKYTVGNQVISSTIFSSPVTDIFLRTRAANNSKMELTNLFLNGQSLGNLVSNGVGNSDIDYLQIGKLPQSFTLTGTSIMSWTGTRPNNSALAYQIKVGTTPQAVPEPTTLAALFLAGGMVVFGSKNKKQIMLN
ncbi:hypothetical protein NIES4101_38920 [Calothrix sp. NIES-4101]|nr:hypothetical protein NIES4101_38920 [Calothrix sp. NIES-4101]